MRRTLNERARSEVVEGRWAEVTFDAAGVDRDIEAALRRLEARHGLSRERANDEIVRRLSFAA
jgi:hypothetical protein